MVKAKNGMYLSYYADKLSFYKTQSHQVSYNHISGAL